MKLGKLILTLPFIWVLAALGACDRQPAAEPEMELRTYSVPVAHQQQIESALSAALIIKKATVNASADVWGRVSLIDKGQLLVSAPPGIQKDIAKFLSEFQPSEPTPQRQTAVDFWVVIADGQRGAAGSDPQLDEIGEPLEAIRKAQNVQGLTLVERLSVNSERGRQSVKGARVSIEMQGGTPMAEMESGPGVTQLGIKAQQPGFRVAELHTALKLQPGKAIVLAQSGLARDPDNAQAAPASIFYVVRARALD